MDGPAPEGEMEQIKAVKRVRRIPNDSKTLLRIHMMPVTLLDWRNNAIYPSQLVDLRCYLAPFLQDQERLLHREV